jgi:tetratricopeptide (TPR) repeat protein
MASSALNSAAGGLMSAHRDVLEAPIPEDAGARERLIEELKSRARAAVGCKSWKDAELLYHRAIEIDDSNAVLYSNLSLVQLNMGFLESACEAAQKAVELDASYVKGHWRLGQSLCKLQRNEEALEAFQDALMLDPTNKALKKECQKLEKVVDEEKALMEMDIDNKINLEATETVKENVAETASKAVTAASITTTGTEPSKQEPATTVATKTSTSTENDDDEGVFSKSDHVRGYKVVNGKKTSYFHNELSEDAKQLIGDIAPKRIDPSEQPALPSSAPQKVDGASAWNQAGTWEERDVTTWAKETLKENLMNTTYVLPESSPAPGAIASVTSVPNLDGHASYATVRGKKRYIYEFCITVAWQLELVDDDKTAKGKMTFPDFDGTCELGEGYDMVHWEVDHDSPGSLRPILDRFVQSGGLRDALHDTLDEWVRNFRTTY